jgi:hypothetical protein
MRSTALLASLLIALVAAGCAGDTDSEEFEESPAIRGTITRVEPGGDPEKEPGRILIEADPSTREGAKDWVTIRPSTGLYRLSDTGMETIQFPSLRPGLQAEAWYIGGIRESYPRQADGRRIVIRPMEED